MSSWDDIKKSVVSASRAIEYFVNEIANTLAFIPEIIGTGAYDGLTWIGSKIGASSVFKWLGAAIKNSCSILGAFIKGIFGVAGGIISASIKITGGILTAQGSVILRGIWDLLSPTIGTIILVIGKFIALVQSLFFLQGFERPLTSDEKAQLRTIFHKSINLYLIRIIEGHSGLYDLTGRAFTLGNTLYLKTSLFPNSLLVHECSHSWQYHHTGNRYTSDALGAQWFVDDAYNWFKEIDIRNKINWRDFNPEAQAEFLEDIWKHARLVDKNGNTIDYGKGSFYKADNQNSFGLFEAYGKNLTDLAQNTISQIRKRW